MNNYKYKQLIIWLSIIVSGVILFIFCQNDDFLYKDTIARVETVKIGKSEQTTDEYSNKDKTTQQTLQLKILNGRYKGKSYNIINTYSRSGGLDQKYQVGQKVFINLHHQGKHVSVSLGNYKRDTYLIMMLWLVLVLLYALMRFHGLRTMFSVAINFVIFLLFIQLDVGSDMNNFFWLFALSALIFTFISLLIVIGPNKQFIVTFMAIVLGTSTALILGYATLQLTSSKGVHYEALDFATQSPEQLFFSATVIGLLGAVMDAATDIVSTLFEIKRTQPDIQFEKLYKSGMQVGHAIMGPLINVLFLIFFAETITIAILYFKTGNTIAYTFEWAMSLGVVQALISGIGITLVIPAASVLSSLFLGKKVQ